MVSSVLQKRIELAKKVQQAAALRKDTRSYIQSVVKKTGTIPKTQTTTVKQISTPQTPEEIIAAATGERPISVPTTIEQDIAKQNIYDYETMGVATKIETKEPVFEPVHEYSQKSLTGKLETQEKQQVQQLIGIKPTGFYLTSENKIISGYEAQKQISQNISDIKTTKKEIKTYPTGTTFTETKQGFDIKLPEDITLRQAKYYRGEASKLPPGVSEITRLGMGISSSMYSLSKPLADLLGIGKAHEIGTAIGFSYALHPFNTKEALKSFQKGLIESRYGVHYPSTMDLLFEPIGWSPKGSTKFITSDPWFMAGGLGGEIAQSIGFTQATKGIKTGLKYFVKTPTIQSGITKIGTKISKGIPSIISETGMYMPKTLKTGYSKIFGKTVPGMLSIDVGKGTIKKSGGVVSRFLYESKYGLKGGTAATYFLRKKPAAIGKIAVGYTKTEGKNILATITGAKGTAGYRKYLVGLPRITEPVGYTLKKIPGFNLAYTSVKRKLLVGTKTMWTTRKGIIGGVARSGKIVAYTPGDITGLASKTRFKISGLFGRKIDVSKKILTTGIRSWDDIIRVKAPSVIDDIIRPGKKLIPSTVKGNIPGVTTGGGLKLMSIPSNIIEEISYKPVSKLFPESMLVRSIGKGIGKSILLKSLYGTGYFGVKTYIKGAGAVKTKPLSLDVNIKDIAKYSGLKSIYGKTNIPAQADVLGIIGQYEKTGYRTDIANIDTTDVLPIRSYDILTGTILKTDIGKISKLKTGKVTSQLFKTTETFIPKGFFIPPPRLYGRGFYYGMDGLFGLRYKHRKIKTPSLTQIGKQTMKIMFGGK